MGPQVPLDIDKAESDLSWTKNQNEWLRYERHFVFEFGLWKNKEEILKSWMKNLVDQLKFWGIVANKIISYWIKMIAIELIVTINFERKIWVKLTLSYRVQII